MRGLYEEDVQGIVTSEIVPWDSFRGKTVVVTGATGLVGGMVVRALVEFSGTELPHTKVVLPVRNALKAKALFGDSVELVQWDAESGEIPQIDTCDYLIHCASNTDSRQMVERPVNTILATVEGTRSMLELSKRTGAHMVFTSSMEVYASGSDEPLDECQGGALDAMNVRSSYPQSKQLAETLCASYASQYDVAVCVARLAQSFGPGIASNDRRVFAEFARCCRDGKNITLLTDGSKSNMYVYTADAVKALLLLAVKGSKGEAYNVANEATFCSIWEMAQMVSRRFGPSTRVTRVIDEEAARRYAVSGRLWLDTAKIRELGWVPERSLEDMYGRMMQSWE